MVILHAVKGADNGGHAVRAGHEDQETAKAAAHAVPAAKDVVAGPPAIGIGQASAEPAVGRPAPYRWAGAPAGEQAAADDVPGLPDRRGVPARCRRVEQGAEEFGSSGGAVARWVGAQEGEAAPLVRCRHAGLPEILGPASRRRARAASAASLLVSDSRASRPAPVSQ